MSTEDIPKEWQNDESEWPDADQFNANLAFLNMAQENYLENPSFEEFQNSLFDDWDLSGTGAAAVEAATQKHGDRAADLSFGSAAAVLAQTIAELTFHKGRKLIAWCWVKTSTTSQARIRIDDGVGSTGSAYHTGGGDWELLVVTHDTAAGATAIKIELRVETAGAADFDAAFLGDYWSLRSHHRGPDTAQKAKGWAKFAGADATVEARRNVGSVTRNGQGDYTVSWDIDFSSANYIAVATALHASAVICTVSALAAGTTQIKCWTDAGAAVDPTSVMVVAFGLQ